MTDKGNEVINGSISPHNDLNVDKFHQEKTEVKTEENVAEKEPESDDEIESRLFRQKLNIENWRKLVKIHNYQFNQESSIRS